MAFKDAFSALSKSGVDAAKKVAGDNAGNTQEKSYTSNPAEASVETPYRPIQNIYDQGRSSQMNGYVGAPIITASKDEGKDEEEPSTNPAIAGEFRPDRQRFASVDEMLENTNAIKENIDSGNFLDAYGLAMANNSIGQNLGAQGMIELFNPNYFNTQNIGGKDYLLNQLEDGSYTLANESLSDFNKEGYSMAEGGKGYAKTGTFDDNGNFKPAPEGVVTFNGKVIDNPDDEARFIYDFMRNNSDEFNRLLGRDIGDDLFEFRSNPALWGLYNRMMHEGNEQQGLWSQTMSNPEFFDDTGAFNFWDVFVPWMQRELDWQNVLRGGGSDLANDLFASGGLGSWMSTAAALSKMDDLKFGLNGEIPDEILAYERGDITDPEVRKEWEKYSDAGSHIGKDETGNYFTMSPDQVYGFVLNQLATEGMTNPTRDLQYSGSDYNSELANKINYALGNSERYFDLAEGDTDPGFESFGTAPGYINPWNISYDDWARYAAGERFNPAAVIQQYNNNMRRRQY